VQLAGLVCLGPEITCSGATTYEVSRKDGLDDGAEDSLGATLCISQKNPLAENEADAHLVCGRAIHKITMSLNR